MSGIYFLESAENLAGDPSLVGAKAAALNTLLRFRIAVPPGFTISTRETAVLLTRGMFSAELENDFDAALEKLEARTKRAFESCSNPLLVSIRSGAPISMPGMLDTVLNLGMNEDSATGLVTIGGERFAADVYGRFLRSFGRVVLKLSDELLSGIGEERTLSEVQLLKRRIEKRGGVQFPNQVGQQLRMARDAVCFSWRNSRAVAYRKLTNMPESDTPAVTVQQMVFGNLDCSAVGIGFTRDPFTGKHGLSGEVIFEAQGMDLASGLRTPKPIAEVGLRMKDVYGELLILSEKLEEIFGTAQQFEFTIESKHLYVLQTRSSFQTVDVEQRRPFGEGRVIGSGLPASPGFAKGRIALNAAEVITHAENGNPSILVRTETSPDDLLAFNAAEGILTCRGGITSHAAVITRGLGIPSVVGAADCSIDIRARELRIGTSTLSAGDWIAIDGASGLIYRLDSKTKTKGSVRSASLERNPKKRVP